MKTSELTDKALDWAVAKCEGVGLGPRGSVVYYHEGEPAMWQPSTDWAQGGPIIEREGIELRYWGLHSVPWKASIDGDTDAGVVLYEEHGTTPLIAAMRCYVTSKMGDEVEVPEELF